MVYDGIREADLADACVELTVWDRDRLASNLLGGLRLGAGTGTGYAEHLLVAFLELCGPVYPKLSQLGLGWVILKVCQIKVQYWRNISLWTVCSRKHTNKHTHTVCYKTTSFNVCFCPYVSL